MQSTPSTILDQYCRRFIAFGNRADRPTIAMGLSASLRSRLLVFIWSDEFCFIVRAIRWVIALRQLRLLESNLLARANRRCLPTAAVATQLSPVKHCSSWPSTYSGRSFFTMAQLGPISASTNSGLAV